MSSTPPDQTSLRLATAIALSDVSAVKPLLTPEALNALISTLRDPASQKTFGDQLVSSVNLSTSPYNRRQMFSNQLFYQTNKDPFTNLLAFSQRPDEVFDIARLLFDAGWKPAPNSGEPLLSLCSGVSSSSRVVWLAENRALFSESLLDQAIGTAFVRCFREQRQDNLADLERLVAIGFLRDADGQLGMSDFMAQGQFKSAETLAQLGFKPRPLTLRRRFNFTGMSAVSSYMRLVNEMDPQTPDDLAQAHVTVKRDLERLHALGAPFGAATPASSCYGDIQASEPFLASLYARMPARLVGSFNIASLYVMAYDKLKELGADINATGEYLAGEISSMRWSSGDPLFFNNALRLGADPTLRPGLTLSAPAAWIGHEAVKSKDIVWMDKLIALGADMSAIPLLCDHREHPVAHAIAHKNHAYANAALERGASPQWISSEHGESCLHLLASQLSKPALALTRRLLNLPAMKALVDHPRRSINKKGGETALMDACGALNAPVAQALLAAGANPNALDAKGNTPLHHAGRKFGVKAEQKCATLIATLLAAGADPSIANAAGLTPAQTMAKRAPLEGLSALLTLRPEDLTGPGKGAKKATASLLSRGAQAVSVVERVILGADSELSAGAAKPRSRL